MILTLEVIGEQAQDLGAGGRKVFNGVGGTIGRLPDNDWVFADPYVSGRHALIRYLNGKYFVEDTSTNGVFINSPDRRLSRTDSHQLCDGDVLFIDAYQIKVSLAKDPAAEQRNDPLALLQARNKKARAASENHSTGTQWFGINDMSSDPKPAPPAPPAANGRIEAPRVVQSGGDDAQLRALLAAAGIKGLDLSSEAAQVALLSAMRVAFESMLAQLDANRQSAFRSLFANAFAKAYEEQLQRLRGSARGRET
jgi:type VI secretion system FHA domain protein